MRKLKLFFACLLMAVLSIGQMWAVDYEYQMVTSVDQVTAGTYVVGALRSTTATNNFYFGKASVSSGDWVVSDNYVTVAESGGVRKFDATSLPTGAVEFELTGNNTDGFTIKNGTKYLYYTAASNRKLAFAANGSSYKWTVSAKSSPLISGGVVLKKKAGLDGNYTISENSTAVGAIRGYANTTEYRAIYLFKKQEKSGTQKPIISFEPVAGQYTTAQNVILSSESGATIYYTTDGTAPSTTSSTYSSAIPVSSTTTIKAFASKGGVDGDVCTAKYEFPLETMDEIFEKATEVGTTATAVNIKFNNWVVSGVSTNGKQVFVTDGTKGFLIYNNGGDMGFARDNVLSGTVACKVQKYNGYAQITNLNSSTTGLTVTTGGSVSISEVAAANLAGKHTGSLIKITGTCTESSGKYYISDGTTSFQIYNSLFAYTIASPGAVTSVTGVYQQFNNTKEILPRESNDIEVPVVKSPANTYWNGAASGSMTIRANELVTNLWSTVSTGTKHFNSSEESVATIAANGDITIHGEGTTVLTYTTDANDNYYAGEATLTLTVKAALPAGASEFTWVAAEKGYENAEAVETATGNEDPISIVFAQGEGSNAPKYYTSGSAVRSYVQNTITISSATEGKLIYGIEIVFANGTNNKLSGEDLTVDGTAGTWAGLAPEVVFNVPNASGNQAHLVSINVIYADGTETSLSIENINLKTTDGETALSITKNVDATINYTGLDESVATISANKVTPVGVGSTTVTASIPAGSNYTAAETTFTITVAEKQIPAMSFPQIEYNANLGETFTAPTLTKPDGVSIKYSSNNAAVSVDENTGAITLNAEGTGIVITATSVENDDYAVGTASYTLTVTDPNKDYFTAEAIGISSTQYGDWTKATFGSGITYKGNSAKNGTDIQVRASSGTQVKSGIVATTTKGYVRSVEVASITAERNLDVYGSNEAYSSPADLYGDAAGTLIGTLNTATKSLEISGNYKYIGLRSRSGAIQLGDITIHWEAKNFSKYTVTYKAGEATGDDVEVKNIEEGTTIQLQDNAYSYAGHVFAGWSDGTNVYEEGDDYTVNGDVILTAQWAEQFNVTYNPGEAGGDAIVRTVAAGAYNLEAGNIFTYAGHAFDGWLKDETKYNAGASYTISENVAFTAQWVEAVDPVTVTFDATIDISDQTTSITKNGITITASKFDNDEEGKYYYQCYASSAMTVSSEVGNITNIELTCTAEGIAKYGPGNWEFAGYSYNSYNGSWAGSAETVEFGTASLQVRMTQIVVTYIPNGNTPKQPAGLSYDQTSYSIAQNEGFTAPTVNNPNNLVVTYSGNNDAVATVNEETGAITLGEATGTVTITASAAAQGNYNAGTASYTLTVNAPVVIDELTGTWTLVTDASQLVAGKKVIIASVPDEGAAVTMSTTQAANNRIGLAGATVSEGVITAQNGTAVFTIEAGTEDNTIAFKSSADKYLYAASSSSNYIRSQGTNDANGSWIVTIDEGIATIVAQGEYTHNVMRYNPNNGSPIFACYASTSTTGTLVTLYMHQDDEPAPSEDWVEVRGELTPGHYYTICLPKKVTDFRGASVWNMNKRNAAETEVYLEEAELPFAAGTPFIIQAIEDKLEVVYEGAAVTEPVANGALRGTLTGFTIEQFDALTGNVYILKDNAIRPRMTGQNYLSANRAYILYNELVEVAETPLPAPGRRVVAMPMQGQTATGMENVQGDNVQCTKVLIDGQLFIIRGEKMYDTTGRLVK
jgi:hypothetical protein